VPNHSFKSEMTVSANDQPLVSVIIPAYNASETICRAIESVYAQTDTEQQVLSNFPDVIYIRQENKGASAARNRAVQASSGEFIATLDADDEWLPEKTALQVEVLSCHPKHPFVCLGPVQPQDVGAKRVDVREYGFRDYFEAPAVIWPNSWLVRRESFERAGGYDETFYNANDAELLVRVCATCGPGLVMSAGQLYIHYTEHSRLTAISTWPTRARNYMRMIEKWNPQQSHKGCKLWNEAEFRETKASWALSAAWNLCHNGFRHEAKEYFRIAQVCCPHDLTKRWVAWMGMWRPFAGSSAMGLLHRLALSVEPIWYGDPRVHRKWTRLHKIGTVDVGSCLGRGNQSCDGRGITSGATR